ncbi:polysaccharide deacetylase family protein [Nocardia goodfellowii]|uniref:Peptidoglycan/xylan/chitin deacetylase (PgdA/CDA1 family) n=1 Tax=Nocardia goodfellowii TaxID=882446 RepID=A0ABS4QP35_9NOCA|nr:polysaccharide deacetylase family protein [Nocardia goodfellowii]MBP2192890.1 peptidoglycan/xylan/chitin deacetylase (PgdA/CDA1 family) [Nocardia goodfellowii]
MATGMVRSVLAALLFAAAAGCANAEPEAAPPPTAPAPAVPPAPTLDPVQVRANELGLVPVLMYHQFLPAPTGDYDQTLAEFRDELERLYREGYRPVTAAEYISGAIDIPAGTHPVVLTFDDSTASQFAFGADGGPAPNCAVGILEEFRARYPDFRPKATFYVNNEPFGNHPRALTWLAEHGYEVGSHTANHPNLARLDGVGVQREFAENVRAIEAAVPGKPVRTMALPLGIAPADRALAGAGHWAGTSYRFDAVMLVGAEPAPSPYGTVDPTAVPRIRSGKGEVLFDSAYWLDRLAENPALRYTSDGDPARISFPATGGAEPAAAWSTRANPY